MAMRVWFTLASTITGITDKANQLPIEYQLSRNYPTRLIRRLQ